MKLRQNKKGVTLIESIVTIAIIAILLGTMGVALTNIIHYMGESALIKNTSNEIFENIQNTSYTEFTTSDSIMTFKEGLTVSGTTKTVEKSYNDKDKLTLSVFSKNVNTNVYNGKANFYLLKNPSDKDSINNTYQVNSGLNPIDNCVKEGTITTTDDKDYVSSHVNISSIDENMLSECIQKVIAEPSYTNITLDQTSVEWYRVVQESDQSLYSIYGIVKPYNINKRFNVIFRSSNPNKEYMINDQVLINGFTDKIIDEVRTYFSEWRYTDILSSPQILSKTSFTMDDLKDPMLFDSVENGATVYIYIKEKDPEKKRITLEFVTDEKTFTITVEVSLNQGISQKDYDAILKQFNNGKHWRSDSLNGGKKFQIKELYENQKIFNNIPDNSKITIVYD